MNKCEIFRTNFTKKRSSTHVIDFSVCFGLIANNFGLFEEFPRSYRNKCCKHNVNMNGTRWKTNNALTLFKKIMDDWCAFCQEIYKLQRLSADHKVVKSIFEDHMNKNKCELRRAIALKNWKITCQELKTFPNSRNAMTLEGFDTFTVFIKKSEIASMIA